jgi:tRNA threonylcarbamoyladenosine modification (KEOPS) complex  Pcc1 subunit
LSTNDNFVNTLFAKLGTVQAKVVQDEVTKRKGEHQMNKNQKPITLKVRKGLPLNHNETALKVRRALEPNHNETFLKISKGIKLNHNETALKVRKGVKFNHNEMALKVSNRLRM